MKYFESVEDIEGRYYYPKDPSKSKPLLAALEYVLETEGQVVYFQSKGAVNAELDRSGLGSDSDRKFYFSKEKFRVSWSVLYHRRDLYYKEYLDRAIQIVTTMGILGLEGNDYVRLDTIKARLNEKKPPRDLGLIKLEHSLTAVMIISSIGVLGIMTFFVELIMYYKDRPLRQLARHLKASIFRKKEEKTV